MNKKLLFLQGLMLLVTVLAPQVARADYYFTVGDSVGKLSKSSVANVTATNPTTTVLGTSGETTYYYFDGALRYDRRFEVNGTVYFILPDDATIEIPAGITVSEGNTLIITSGDTVPVFSGLGTLNVDNVSSDNGNADACIGALCKGTTGTIIIHDCFVNALSTSTKYKNSYAACIGSGYKGSASGTITIDGGRVNAANTAAVGSFAAAIGSGYNSEGTMKINIYGGEVTAYAVTNESSDYNAYGAGIGTGYSATSLNLNITGGNITAASKKSGSGHAYGAGIGTGALAWYPDDYKVDINISGGTIYAYSGSGDNYEAFCYGAGIGTGMGLSTGKTSVTIDELSLYREASTTMTTHINITGGNIKAYSCANGSGDGFGAGIGGGYNNAPCVINITAGEITAASSKFGAGNGAGIGSGEISNKANVGLNSPNAYGYAYCEVNISGGTILAYSGGGLKGTGKGYGAGIGCGEMLTTFIAKVNITGGNVTAYSCYGDGGGDGGNSGKGYGAGIGIGYDHRFKNNGTYVRAQVTCAINISGGTIKAVSSRDYIGYGAGIGAGMDCKNCKVNVNISGGTVNACSGENYAGFWNHDGAGIGGGEDGGCDSIIITGGNIKAYCSFATGGGMNAAGIGNGESGDDCKRVSITGDETVVETLGDKAIGAEIIQIAAKDQINNVALVQMGKTNETVTDTETTKAIGWSGPNGSLDYKYLKATFIPLNDKVVYYKDDKGKVQSCQAQKLTGGGTLKGTYYVDDSFTASRIIVSDSLHLILLDGCNLTANGCIVVEGTNELTITCGDTTANIAGTGKLTVTDETGGNNGNDARIGSREGNNCGYININGGNITAYSTYTGTYSIHGADIGSGHEGSNGCIVINDGKVYCQGGQYLGKNSMSGAGIGSGYEATSGTVWIRIHGGKVRTWPTNNYTCWGAGIGTGQGAKGRADIVIDGGEVEALSSTVNTGKGAGIGTGCDYKASDKTTIEINGGTVYACSSGCGDSKKGYGAGIGMGSGWSSSYGKVDISITGGTVHAYSGNYYAYGAGIGGGDDGGCGNIVISGTADVGAYNCRTYNTPEGPGIGDGDEDKTGSLYVYGDQCTVETWGLYGIGNGDEGEFQAFVYPMGGYGKIQSGDTCQDANAQVITFKTNGQNAYFGSSRWRRISFQTVTQDVYYTDENGEVAGPVSAIVCSSGVPSTMGGDSTGTAYYYVNQKVEAEVRTEIHGNAMIILGDNATMSAPAGIKVEGDNTLTLTAGGTETTYKGSGTLTSTLLSSENAAIGSNGYYDNPYPASCGNIIINGGNINAKAYYYGAGIGGGKNAARGGSITINGGTINANASPGDVYHGYGAGIGGGSNCTNPDITIKGGSIKAYSTSNSQGWGAGIGAGNGAAAGNITITGGTIVAASSENSTNWGAGIGGGYDENGDSILEGGMVLIFGDEADVTATGAKSLVATAALAAGGNADAIVDYGASSSDYSTYTHQNIALLAFGSDSSSVSDYAFAHIYFSQRKVNVYYTQEDGTVSSNAVEAYDCVAYLPKTLGDGTETPVYYYLYDKPEQEYRSVVSGNAVIVLGDDCEASVVGGITVEEGNTLTITTGDTIKGYNRTGAIDVLSNDTDNAAIGSTKPVGDSKSSAGHTAGTINIYNGSVVAHVAEKYSDTETFAAAIGGGAGNGNAGVINITGGYVQAYSAYSGTGNGAGIGGGNGEWFGRKDGGNGGTVTISGNAMVEAYSSYLGTAAAAGIGYGRYASSLSNYTGTVTIKGDNATVTAQGECAIYGTAATATPKEMATIVDYGESVESYSTYAYAGEVNLLDFNGTSLSSVKYAIVLFGTGTTLAEALDSTENVSYTISDNLYIVEATDVDQVLWCTDSKGNWVKVISDDYEALKTAKLLKGYSIVGTMSDLDTNPVFTLSETPTTASSDTTIDIAGYNVAYNFSEVKPDEIATFTGYYFVENGTPKFRGFGGTNPNHKGQSLVLDLTKYVSNVSMTEGNLYTLRCAVQINAAWDEETTSSAPRRVSKSDGDTYFTNYTAYALKAPQEVTGITENTLNKEISHIDYVNTVGQVSTEPWQGINIVVTHFTDGSTSTAKVVK